MPCTPNSVFGLVPTTPSGPPSEIWIWPISTIAALAVLDCARHGGVGRRVGRARAADCRARRAAQVAFTGNGMSTTVPGSVPPPAAIPLKWSVIRIVALPCKLSGVVGAVRRVGAAARGHAGLATDVGAVRCDGTSESSGGPGVPTTTSSLTNAFAVRRGAVGVGATDGERRGRLNRRVTGRERQRRPVRPVRCCTLVEGRNDRDPERGRALRPRVCRGRKLRDHQRQ